VQGDGAQQGITRRTFLVGGAAAAALAAGAVVARQTLPLRDYYYRLAGGYGEPGRYPARGDVAYEYGLMSSAALGRDVAYGVARPLPADRPLASPGDWNVLLCLPGRGRSPADVLEGHHRLGDFAAEAILERDVTSFTVVAVDGGDTYWHRRATGEDAMAMLLDEFVPFCERQLMPEVRGLAVMGWSMGGYGALRAAELAPGRFAAVCAVSPALWRSYDDGVGDAFDDIADYERNDVFGPAGELQALAGGGAPAGVRLDCGRQDVFFPAVEAFAARLDEVGVGWTGRFERGGHDTAFWRRVAPDGMDFIGRSLPREAGDAGTPSARRAHERLG
jgi:pimeloyl-ACP methyl ester carboxylesterase